MADLRINIGATITGLQRGLADAKSRVAGWARGVRNAIGSVGGAIAGAFTVGAIVNYTRNLITMGDEIGKASKRIGVSAEEFQKLTFAARRSGASSDDVEKAFKRMASFMDDVRNGLSTAVRSLEALGLSLDDLKGKSPERQFALIAEQLAKVEDASLKSALAQDVFGRAGTALIPMLNDYRALAQEITDLGGIIDNEAVAAAERFKDEMENLGVSIQATVANSGLLEWLSDIAGSIGEIQRAKSALGGGGVSVGNELKDVFTKRTRLGYYLAKMGIIDQAKEQVIETGPISAAQAAAGSAERKQRISDEADRKARQEKAKADRERMKREKEEAKEQAKRSAAGKRVVDAINEQMRQTELQIKLSKMRRDGLIEEAAAVEALADADAAAAKEGITLNESVRESIANLAREKARIDGEKEKEGPTTIGSVEIAASSMTRIGGAKGLRTQDPIQVMQKQLNVMAMIDKRVANIERNQIAVNDTARWP